MQHYLKRYNYNYKINQFILDYEIIMKNVFFFIIGIVFINSFLYSQYLCKDYILLDGLEPIRSYGFDTTYNWWAITEPFKDQQRSVINGVIGESFNYVTSPTFSPDGKRWAYFGENNVSLYIITNDSIIDVGSAKPGKLVFSGNSEKLIYSKIIGNTETIYNDDKTYEIVNGVNTIYTNYWGNSIAFRMRKSYNTYVIKDNKDFGIFDDVVIYGFDNNGKVVYAGFSGHGWQIYKDNKPITDTYSAILEGVGNIEGTVFAFLIRNLGGKCQSVLVSDEYYEPLVSQQFDKCYNLVLHPNLSLYSYNAERNLNKFNVYNSAEYPVGRTVSPPKFSYDGEELYYISCEIDCSFSINGKRNVLNSAINSNIPYAAAPRTQTFAYSSYTSLVVSKLNTKDLSSGMMVDVITPPRYNRFDERYEALGTINNRLYLLTCKPK